LGVAGVQPTLEHAFGNIGGDLAAPCIVMSTVPDAVA
jgi:hypothetical protein